MSLLLFQSRRQRLPQPPSKKSTCERTARGDAKPLRVITGPATRLNWPAQIFFDAAHDELFVANDGDHSVLVFDGTAGGNAAPTRVIKGAKTGLANPTGVWVDVAHEEVVVSNMGNHTAPPSMRAARRATSRRCASSMARGRACT